MHGESYSTVSQLRPQVTRRWYTPLPFPLTEDTELPLDVNCKKNEPFSITMETQIEATGEKNLY